MRLKFKAFTKDAGQSNQFPSPSLRALPEWYKKLPRFINGDTKWKFDEKTLGNATIKWCMPFLDAMSLGYMVYLENDIEVQKEDGATRIVWKRGGEEFISTHQYGQLAPEQIPDGYSKTPYKFLNEWSIQPPKGYSLLFTHPMNRTDLPFLTLSGLVDSDKYQSCVNFPFLLKKDFEGIIEAGTPIAQIIPIKREFWKHSIEPYDEKFSYKTDAIFNSKIYRVYKKLFWVRKNYS